METPPPTQQAVAGATRTETPERGSATPTPAPETPQQTQAAEDVDEDMEDDEFDYVQDDELDYGSDEERPFWGREDDREDIGEDDDWQNAVGRTGNVSMQGEYMEDDY